MDKATARPQRSENLGLRGWNLDADIQPYGMGYGDALYCTGYGAVCGGACLGPLAINGNSEVPRARAFVKAGRSRNSAAAGLHIAMAAPLTLEGVTLSTIFDNSYAAAQCTDGSLTTMCATEATSAGNNWVAVQVPVGSSVGQVAVYNRRDFGSRDPVLRWRSGCVGLSRICASNNRTWS